MRISAEEVRRIEQRAILEYAIPSLLLMENAGRSVSEVVFRDYPDFYFLLIDGSQDCPNFNFVEIDKNWD